MPIENGKYVTRHEWYAHLYQAGYWWESGHARLTEEGEFTAGLSAFEALTPLWGGCAFIGFTETAWVFFDFDWRKVGNDDHAVNVWVDPVLTVPYPVVPDKVLPTRHTSASLVRSDEKYHAAGYGKADAGTNSVIVGPVVEVDGEFRLFVLQARQSGKMQSASVSVHSFSHSNKFSLPLRPYDEVYDLVPGEETEAVGAEIQYSVSNPLWRRVSAGMSVSLAAAVALSVKAPSLDPESTGTAEYLSVVSQTLGTGDPWIYVDVLPSSGVTDEVDTAFLAVGVEGIASPDVPPPLLSSQASVPVPGVADNSVCGTPTLLNADQTLVTPTGIPDDSAVGFPVVLVTHRLSIAGVDATAAPPIELNAAADLAPQGIDAPEVGDVHISTGQVVSPGGCDDALTGEPQMTTSVTLTPAGRTPIDAGRITLRTGQRASVAGVNASALGGITVSTSSSSRLLVSGISESLVGEPTLAGAHILRVAGVPAPTMNPPMVGTELVAELAGIPAGSTVGVPRMGTLVCFVPGIVSAAVGNVDLSSAARLNVSGRAGGAAGGVVVLSPTGFPMIWTGVDWLSPSNVSIHLDGQWRSLSWVWSGDEWISLTG